MNDVDPFLCPVFFHSALLQSKGGFMVTDSRVHPLMISPWRTEDADLCFALMSTSCHFPFICIFSPLIHYGFMLTLICCFACSSRPLWKLTQVQLFCRGKTEEIHFLIQFPFPSQLFFKFWVLLGSGGQNFTMSSEGVSKVDPIGQEDKTYWESEIVSLSLR